MAFRRLVAFLLVTPIFVVVGDKGIADEIPSNSERVSFVDIINKNWRLKIISRAGNTVFEPGEKLEVSLRFDSLCKVSGRSVINRYFGQCDVGSDNRLKWKETGFGMTMMAGPPEQMKVEKLYLDSLKQTNRFVSNPSILHLQGEAGLLLVFELSP